MENKSQYLGLATLACLVVGVIVAVVEVFFLQWPFWGPTIAMGFFLGIPISEKIVNPKTTEWSVMWTDLGVYLAIYIVYLLLIFIAVPAIM